MSTDSHHERSIGFPDVGEQPEFSAFRLPPDLKDRYRRLIVVSHRLHVESLGDTQPDTLIVTSDWLLWRQLADEQRSAIHFEGFLYEWDADLGPEDDTYLNACKWMIRDGNDFTLFLGSSLGKQLNTQVMLFTHACNRFLTAFKRIRDRFDCQEVIFYDFRAEFDLFDEETRWILIREFADTAGLELEDRRAPAPPGEHNDPFSPLPFFGEIGENVVRTTLRRVYSRSISTISSLFHLFTRGLPRVYMNLNPLMVEALLEGVDKCPVTPLLVPDYWSKNLSFLRLCFSRGVRFAPLPRTALDPEEKTRVRAIKSEIEAYWGGRRDPVGLATGHFIRQQFLITGWLEKQALNIKRFWLLFRRQRVSGLLVAHAENLTNRILVEQAKGAGGKTFELMNGMVVSCLKTDLRHATGTEPALLDTFLAWGEQQKLYCKKSRVTANCEVSGYPVADMLYDPAEKLPLRRDRVLVLPLMIDGYDVRGIFSNTFAYLVDTVQGLRDLGTAQIRIKLHPGFVSAADAYRRTLEHFGIEAEVRTDGLLQDHLAWADLVVGPINSGSLVETAAAGVPYFPLAGTPSSADLEQFGGLRIYTRVDDLMGDIRNGIAPDRDRTLVWLTAMDDDRRSAVRVWNLIAREIAAT